MQAFDTNGTPLAGATVSLNPGERVSKLVGELTPNPESGRRFHPHRFGQGSDHVLDIRHEFTVGIVRQPGTAGQMMSAICKRSGKATVIFTGGFF